MCLFGLASGPHPSACIPAAPTTDLAATGLVAGASIFGVGLRVSQPLQQSVFSVVVAYAWLPKAR